MDETGSQTHYICNVTFDEVDNSEWIKLNEQCLENSTQVYGHFYSALISRFCCFWSLTDMFTMKCGCVERKQCEEFLVLSYGCRTTAGWVNSDRSWCVFSVQRSVLSFSSVTRRAERAESISLTDSAGHTLLLRHTHTHTQTHGRNQTASEWERAARFHKNNQHNKCQLSEIDGLHGSGICMKTRLLVSVYVPVRFCICIYYIYI